MAETDITSPENIPYWNRFLTSLFSSSYQVSGSRDYDEEDSKEITAHGQKDDVEIFFHENFSSRDGDHLHPYNSTAHWDANGTSSPTSTTLDDFFFPSKIVAETSSSWDAMLNHSGQPFASPPLWLPTSTSSGLGIGGTGGGGGYLGLPSSARSNTTGYLNNLAVAVPMGVSLYALSLLTLVGNAMVLHAIRTERRLQTVSNMFIMSLAIADLTVGMIVMPISSAYAITGDWKFGIVVCQFWLSADYSASTASILNLLILSLDRYWSIRSPLKYMRKRTKKRALVMIGFVWLLSSMWIIPIIGWHFWYNDGIRKQPSNVCETEFADNVLFKLSTSTANFYVPMVLMIALYVKIFYEIKKRSKFEIGQCNVGGSGSTRNSTQDIHSSSVGICKNGSSRSFRESGSRFERSHYGKSSSFRYTISSEKGFVSRGSDDSFLVCTAKNCSLPKEDCTLHDSVAQVDRFNSSCKKNRLDIQCPGERTCRYCFPEMVLSQSNDSGKRSDRHCIGRPCLHRSNCCSNNDFCPQKSADIDSFSHLGVTETVCKQCYQNNLSCLQNYKVDCPIQRIKTSHNDRKNFDIKRNGDFLSFSNSSVNQNGNGNDLRGKRCTSLHVHPQTCRFGVAGYHDKECLSDVTFCCELCGIGQGAHKLDNKKILRQRSDDGRYYYQTTDAEDKCLPQTFEDVSVNVDYVQGEVSRANRYGTEATVLTSPTSNHIKSHLGPQDFVVISNNVGDNSCLSASTLSLTLQKAPHGVSRCVLKSWRNKDKSNKNKLRKVKSLTNDDMEMGELKNSSSHKIKIRSKKKHDQSIEGNCALSNDEQSVHLQVPRERFRTLSQASRSEGSSFRSTSSFRGGTRILSNFSTLRMKVTRRNLTSSLKQEKKAARQLGVIMGAFVLCWLPYIILFIVTACCEDCLNPDIHTAAIWLGYLNSTMNPFLYALCNANFKRAFKKIFRRGSKNGFYATTTSAKNENMFA